MRALHQKIHHHLKLQHHRYTGRVLHHRHTSYRALAIVFALTGIAMLSITLVNNAAAASLVTVQATKQTPVPTTAALIATPANGDTLNTNSTLVTGSCPVVTPQVMVTLLVDGTNVGSAACDSNNDFSLPVTFSAGSHTLVAQTYTITDQPGPASTPVRINSPAGTAQAISTSPIVLTAAAPLSYLGATKTATWSGTITGGTPPYHVHIDWNDGKQTDVNVKAGKQSFSHMYTSLTSYDPLISVIDSAGNAVNEQFTVSAYTTASPQTSLTAYNDSASQSTVSARTLFGLYGLFITTISICGIIWVEARHTARQAITIHT